MHLLRACRQYWEDDTHICCDIKLLKAAQKLLHGMFKFWRPYIHESLILRRRVSKSITELSSPGKRALWSDYKSLESSQQKSESVLWPGEVDLYLISAVSPMPWSRSAAQTAGCLRSFDSPTCSQPSCLWALRRSMTVSRSFSGFNFWQSFKKVDTWPSPVTCIVQHSFTLCKQGHEGGRQGPVCCNNVENMAQRKVFAVQRQIFAVSSEVVDIGYMRLQLTRREHLLTHNDWTKTWSKFTILTDMHALADLFKAQPWEKYLYFYFYFLCDEDDGTWFWVMAAESSPSCQILQDACRNGEAPHHPCGLQIWGPAACRQPHPLSCAF